MISNKILNNLSRFQNPIGCTKYFSEHLDISLEIVLQAREKFFQVPYAEQSLLSILFSAVSLTKALMNNYRLHPCCHNTRPAYAPWKQTMIGYNPPRFQHTCA